MPSEVLTGPKALHRLSFRHRKLIELSEECGCFYCFKTFAPRKIHAWADGGETALCPYCRTDAVLPSHGLNRPLSQDLLEAMGRTYFLINPKSFPKQAAPADSEGQWPESVSRWLAPSSADASSFDALPLQSSQLKTDSELRDRIWFELPSGKLLALALAWAAWGVSLSVPPAVAQSAWGLMAWVAGLAIMAAVGWKLSRACVVRALHAGFALQALALGNYAHPSLAKAIGSAAGTDFTPARANEMLYREARDWARALPEMNRIWSAWQEGGKTIRRHDLRHFVRVARAVSGRFGPYAYGDPL